MNTGYRHAIAAVAVALTIVALGAAITLQAPGSSSSVSSPSSSTSSVPTASQGFSTSSPSSTMSSTVTTMTISRTTSSMILSSTSSASTSVSSASSTSGPTGSSTTSELSSSSSGQNGTEIVLPYDVGENESLNFQPASITVVVGVNNTVTWIDLDSIQHTVVSTSIPAGAQKFDSGILNQGQTFSWTFTVPGTYYYVCTIHPDWMKGIIRVVA